MKLRNKKTGEVKDWDFGNWYQHILNPDNKESYECTLSEFMDRTAKFREEWEDYKEPKESWYIYGAEPFEVDESDWDKEFVKELKSIGNYFGTREEAEKAVEKLKAWKRLKDKGFSFKSWFTRILGGLQINVKFNEYNGISPEDKNDLDLLFGDEE